MKFTNTMKKLSQSKIKFNYNPVAFVLNLNNLIPLSLQNVVSAEYNTANDTNIDLPAEVARSRLK